MPLELLRGSQAPLRAVCGTHGCFWTMHGSVSAPSCCPFTHRVAFEEVSVQRALLKSGPGNRGRSACGTTPVAHFEFPRADGLILRCAGKAGNPFQTTQGNRYSCRDQEGRRGSDEVVPEPRCSPQVCSICQGTFGVPQGCQVLFRPARQNMGRLLRCCSGQRPHLL